MMEDAAARRLDRMNQYVRGTPYSLNAFSGMNPVVMRPMQLATELRDTSTACRAGPLVNESLVNERRGTLSM
jgi:hypothetical protein